MRCFQFHWTDSRKSNKPEPLEPGFILSIPLNGFGGKSVYLSPACGRGVFQFHWTDSASSERCVEPAPTSDSFQFHWTDSRERYLSGGDRYCCGPFNSIERILHHHGLCTLWKPVHLHYLDSLPLTPQLGVSCILWSPEFICFSVPSPWFFPCVYMGISIATVGPLVYGWGVQG